MIELINYLDVTILFFIQNTLLNPVLDKIMIFATVLGNKGLIWLAIALILIINKKTRYVGLITIITLILATLMGEGILKHLIQRQRPYTDFPLIELIIKKSTAYSFPSGHTTSSFACALVLGKYLKKYSIFFWSLACTIAFSRLYLFMHYPSDIIAGIVLGLACGKIVIYVYEHKKNKIVGD